MSKFKLENRYLVLKIKDIANTLSPRQLSDINCCTSMANIYRQRRGKGPLQAVVIESDWPIYEQVLALLESMNTGHSPDAGKMMEVTSEQPGQFYIGQSVKKVTGEYKISGVVRSVFTKSDGAVRIVVEHTVKDEHGEGSFLHIYGPSNLEPLDTGGAA